MQFPDTTLNPRFLLMVYTIPNIFLVTSEFPDSTCQRHTYVYIHARTLPSQTSTLVSWSAYLEEYQVIFSMQSPENKEYQKKKKKKKGFFVLGNYELGISSIGIPHPTSYLWGFLTLPHILDSFYIAYHSTWGHWLPSRAVLSQIVTTHNTYLFKIK